MEGRVGIVPAAGQGSRFWIELKLAAQPVASGPPPLRDEATD
jgi:hypothetical protein